MSEVFEGESELNGLDVRVRFSFTDRNEPVVESVVAIKAGADITEFLRCDVLYGLVTDIMAAEADNA